MTRHCRRRPVTFRPVPKRSSTLWAAAILTAVSPDICFQILMMLSDTTDGVFYSWGSFGWCAGQEIDFRLQRLLSPVWDLPLLWFGSAPLIALAWGGRLLSERAGCPRLGRILARAAVTVVIARHLPSPLLFVLDASADRGCVNNWGPPEVTGWSLTMDLYYLIPAVLVLLTLRIPGSPRGSRLARAGTAVSLVLTMIIFTVADAAAGRVSDSRALDCAGFGDGTVSGLDESEKGFLCGIRDNLSGSGVPELADMPDRKLLAYGRRLCDLAVRSGGDVRAPAVSKAMSRTKSPSLVGALARLCPKVAKVEEDGARQKWAESDAYGMRETRAGRAATWSPTWSEADPACWTSGPRTRWATCA